jgi:inner membrane protein
LDNLTHSLIGAAIGQTGLKKLSGLGMATLIIAANISDIDAACFLWLEGHEHLAFRRGITHGPPAMLLLPALLTAIMVWFDRWQERRGTRPEARLPVRPKQLFLLALIGCLSHPAFDWLNNYGVRLLEPFSSQWFYGDTLFIIDVWLWAILIGGWFWSRRAEDSGGNWRRRGQVVATVVGLYVFANGVITGVAERDVSVLLAERQAPGTRVSDWSHGSQQRWENFSDSRTSDPRHLVVASPPPFAFWEREVFWRDGDVYGSATFTPGLGARLNSGIAAHQGGDIRLLPNSASNAQLRAYLFWSRMPVVRFDERGLIVRDQRFQNPVTADRFTVRAEFP